MKRSMTVALAILALSVSANARTLRLLAAPNITRCAGQTIPVSFTAAGFSGQTAQIFLVNANNWIPESIAENIPVANGANTLEVQIPWSWTAPGTYVVKIVGGGLNYSSSNTVRIRTAILWPYNGTVYPRDTDVFVVWIRTEFLAADILRIVLVNEDTDEVVLIGDDVDPEAGRLQFHTPDVSGRHFRIHIEGFLLIEEGGELFEDLSEATQSEQVSIGL